MKQLCILLFLSVSIYRSEACVTDSISIAHSICAGDTFYVGNFAHTQAGNYTDTLTNAGGCDSVVSLTLTVNQLPAVSFSWDSLVTAGDVWWFTQSLTQDSFVLASCPDGTGTATEGGTGPFVFLLGGGNPPGGIYSGWGVVNNHFYVDSAVILGQQGAITYTCINGYGCKTSVSDSIFIPICEDISNILISNSPLSLYPNPTTNQLYLKTTNIQPQTISIYDLNGRMLYTTPFKPEIDVTQLSSGVYFVEVNSAEGVVRRRFVKM